MYGKKLLMHQFLTHLQRDNLNHIRVKKDLYALGKLVKATGYNHSYLSSYYSLRQANDYSIIYQKCEMTQVY